MEVFDLTQSLDRIRPNFGIDFLFFAAGCLIAGIAFLCLRYGKRDGSDHEQRVRRTGWWLAALALFWIPFISIMSWGDISQAYAARREAAQGRLRTLEGCLDYFQAGVANAGKSTAGDERWRVGGRAFSYGSNEIRYAYHAVEPLGGIVHADSWVRVSYHVDKFLDRDDIIRLETRPHFCPAAPLPPAGS